MELKRHFQRDATGELIRGSDGQPALAFIEVRHTGTHPEQNFSTRLVEGGQAEGWIEIDGDELTLLAQPEDLHYTIRRRPGRYCLHCGEKLPDDDGGPKPGALARQHVAEKHAGQPSPDPAQPAGYFRTNAWECILDLEQHDRFRAQPLGAGGPIRPAPMPKEA